MPHVGRLRKVARGGLLCDDPGLGKTVTVLSLILQTFGQSTERRRQPGGKSNNDFSTGDDEVFHSYWREGLTSCGRTPALLRLVNGLRRVDRAAYFETPVDPQEEGCENYFDIVKRPISMSDILAKINVHGYGDDFEGLCSDVDLCFRNAMLFNPPEHHVHQAAKRLSERFKAMVVEFKREQAKSAKKAFSNINANPESSVAAILAEKANDELLDSLCPSSGTLLIVPNPLLKHWEEQIMMHVNFKYCTGKIPIVFRHKKKKGSASMSIDDVIELCKIKQTHFPLVFVDEGTSNPLPPPDILSMFRIVITTSQRIIAEWKFGSMEEELCISRKQSLSFRAYFDDLATEAVPASSLLKVHWLRLVVDEGHTMGRGTHSNTIQFASWITSQRRWAMTGTPSQQTAAQSGLRNILGLAKFLKHEFFASRLGGDQAWNELIGRPWGNEGHLVAFFRLRLLLSLLMVRHTKSDIEEIPPPLFVRTYTDMSKTEITSYNCLVSAVHMNIKTTSMKGETSGWQDSLLNPRQSRHATRALNNIRIACCGGTYVLPTLKDQHWVETLQYLRHRHDCDDIKVRMVDNYLRRATTGELSSCMSCGIQLQTLFIVPCGDMVCTECISSDDNSCPACNKEYDVDDFQRLQPGLVYEWTLALKDEKKQREREAALKRALNEGRSNGSGLPNGGETGDESTRSAAQIVDVNEGNLNLEQINEGVPRRRKRKGHQCTFSRNIGDGKCLDCREEHFDCDFITDGSQCSLCYKTAQECPEHASKALYVCEKKLLNLREGNRDTTMSSAAMRLLGEQVRPNFQRPLKVILFSQFRLLLDYMGDRLIRRFGGSCVAEYWGQTRSQELTKFIKSPKCFCMLLGKEGSHGLDLSFVTNIILLDELLDKSLENQVVARAYRMGATGRVEVEQLVARHSVEELIARMNQRESDNDYKDEDYSEEPNEAAAIEGASVASSAIKSRSAEEKQSQQAKLHYLLKNVSLVRKSAATKADGAAKTKKNVGQHTETATVGRSEGESEENGDRKMAAKVRFAE